jgi:uncharacterized membrane protein
MFVSPRGWVLWIGATLGIAVLVHAVTILALPRRIMAKTLARMGAPNTMYFGRRPDEVSRRVVRPSPDLLYAACPFDLSQGPLRTFAQIPHWTYWSVAGFDAATNNFFVRNDLQAAGDSIEIIVLRPGMARPRDDALARIVVYAPTAKGLFLLRYLINDEGRLPELDAIRHQADCETIASLGSSR